jgi:hypothetical protein
MAAQEKAKAAGKKAPIDLLDDAQPPPPAFDGTILPPPNQQEPPPPFELVEQHDPPPAFETVEEPPAYQVMEEDAAPPAPMAPAYEELMDHHQESLDTFQPMQAPSMEDEIMGMEGLSEQERRALVEEQRQIMAQIEQEKSANAAAIAAAAADAFDDRSAPAVALAASDFVAMPSPALSSLQENNAPTRSVDLGGGQQVALHGQERTRAAIENGTAILVQCINCQNWMQVTDTATLMYCPVCSVVSPVERQSAVFTKEEAMQLTADRRMAEQLQNEEYADQEEEVEEKEEETWWDSVTSIFGKKTGAAPAQPHVGVPQQVAPTQRGAIGVARPPGSPARQQGLVAARTGEEETETITFSNSYEEREGLLSNNSSGSVGGGGGVPKARVAERQPLFSCVVDSVSNAASSLGSALTSNTLSEDQEGNVHGVDASSLLAVPNVSRGEGNEEYQPFRTED